MLLLVLSFMTSAPRAEEQKPELRVVCFGDSITGHRPGVPYLQHYMKYSDLLGLMLEARLGPDKAKVFNSGYAGDSSDKRGDRPGAVNRVERDILAHKPDIAVILIGGNDNPKTDDARKKTRENLRKIVSHVKEKGVRVLLLQYHPALPAPKNESKAWKHLAEGANPLIAEVAKDLKVPVLDMGPPMKASAEKLGRGAVADAKDGVHLRPAGEIAYARAIFHKLLNLGWVGPEPGK